MGPSEKRLTGFRARNSWRRFVTAIMITALLLTGAVPSFAWGAEEEHGSVVLPAIDIDDSDAPKIHGSNAIVMDLDTGTVVYEKKADKVVEPASLTKILNCLVVLETLNLDEVVTVPENVETEGSLMWIDPGEKLTVEELIYGMMLESGNDAAQVLGLTAGGGDLDTFSKMMNDRAKKCGAKHTDFKNPNGLNEDRSHLNYTSARDLALIARDAMKHPAFRRVVKTAKHKVPRTNKSAPRTLYNSNICLWQKYQTTEINGKEVPFKYKGCNGIKTGFTSDAGYCYVGSARRNGTDFLVVTLGSEDSEERYQDAIRLWDYAFKKYETYNVLKSGDTAGVQRVWAGEKRNVEVGTQQDLGVTINKGTADQQNFTTEFSLDQSRVEAPVSKGQKVGQAKVFNEKGRLVGQEDLYALASVAPGGPFSHIGIADEDLPQAAAIAGGVVALILLLLIVHGVRRRNAEKRKREAMRSELATMRTAGTGMTASELTDVTGTEAFVPISKGPSRISNKELNAWTSTERQSEPSRTNRRFSGRTSRGSDGTDAPVNTAGAQNAAPDRGTYAGRAPKMTITPRTPFGTGTQQPGTDQPLRGDGSAGNGASAGASYGGASGDGASYGGAQGGTSYGGAQGGTSYGGAPSRPRSYGSMSDEELFSALESTEVYDANQPRRHGKLSDEEWAEIMRRTRRPRPKDPD